MTTAIKVVPLAARPVALAAGACTHCLKPMEFSTSETSVQFCCRGCESAYALLNELGLENYYRIRNRSASIRTASLKTSKPIGDYEFLSDPETIQELAENAPSGGSFRLRFFLDGVHCAACVWVVEKLPDMVKGVRSSRLDLGQSILTIEFDGAEGFKKAPASSARMLAQLGYRPHVLKSDSDLNQLERTSNRRMLFKIGLAAAASGNIMLFAAAIYAGAGQDGNWGKWFGWISWLIATPVFAYSALPFYRSAWAGIRSKTLSIDLPISAALIFGWITSTVSIARGGEDTYFDSLTSLIFLLLLSRYWLTRIQQKMAATSGSLFFLTPKQANLLGSDGHTETKVWAKDLNIGDQVIVHPGEPIPCDGIITHGCSEIDSSIFTGESMPLSLKPGDSIFSGMLNQSHSIRVLVNSKFQDSRLSLILKKVDERRKKPTQSLDYADRFTKIFVAATLILATAIIFANLDAGLSEGFRRALSLLIIACPCALALATPLTLAKALILSSQQGILIQSAESLDRLSTSKIIFFDKTGTLTNGSPELTGAFVLDTSGNFAPCLDMVSLQSQMPDLKPLLQRSKHPISKTLARELNLETSLNLTSFDIQSKEMPGQGIQSLSQGAHLFFGKLAQTDIEMLKHQGAWMDGASASGYSVNQELKAVFFFSDGLRKESKTVIEGLKKLGYQVGMLSGDNTDACRKIASELKISDHLVFSNFSPEQKAELFIRDYPEAVFVGDGANDALALTAAAVGIATQGSLEICLRAADVFFHEAGIRPLSTLLGIARANRMTLFRNYVFSFSYNAVGAIAAAAGFIHPLLAAVLMPLSAVTVFISSSIMKPRPV